jgi:hypothetical protein
MYNDYKGRDTYAYRATRARATRARAILTSRPKLEYPKVKASKSLVAPVGARSAPIPALCVAVIACAIAGPASAATVAGIRLDDTVQVSDSTLVLNGAGKRTRFVFDVYVAGLYLKTKTRYATGVQNAPGDKRISLTLMRNLTADQLAEALDEGIRLNSTAAELAKIKGAIDSLMATMRAIGAAKKGDLLTIDFLADGNTQVALNGAAKDKPIAGSDFQRALLDVWLGAKPVQVDLKEALLGG